MTETRVLIVEDEAIVAHDLRLRLQELGYSIAAIAPSGEDAIQQATALRPDLVLMDIRLQGELDGIAAAAAIRSQLDIPVVYLTGYADAATLQRAKITEPFGYVLKPFDLPELRSTLEMALYKHQMDRRLRASEARYRAVSELTSDLAYAVRVEADGTFVYEWMTEALSRITGFTLEELEARGGWLSLVLAEDAPAARQHLANLLAGQTQVHEGRFVTKSGEVRWVRDYGRPEWDVVQPGGRVVRIYGAVQDITARKQAEEALQKANAVLETRVEERTAELAQANAALRAENTERRRTEKALEDQAIRLALLNEIGSAVAATLELDRVLDIATGLVQECFGYQHVALFTLDRERGELVMRALAGDLAPLFPPALRLPMDRGMVGWSTRQGQYLLANDVRAEPHYVNPDPDHIATLSELSVPLQAGGEIVGVLDLQSPQLDAFSEDDVLVMQTLADQVALAVRNARLYEETRRRARELAALNQAGQAITSTLDLDTVLGQVIGQVQNLIAAEAATVLLHDPAHDELVLAAASGPGSESLVGTRFPATDGIAGWVLREGQPALVNDAQGDPRFCPHYDALTGPTTRSLLAVPLTYRGAVTGVIEAINPVEGAFSAQDRTLLEALAASAALAVENSRLFQAEHERLHQLQQAQAQLVHSEKMAALGRLTASLAHEINNPLQAIGNTLELILDFPLAEEKWRQYLEAARREVERLKSLTGRMLDFARPPRIERQPTAIAERVRYAVALSSKQLQHSHIEVNIDVPDDLPPVLASPDHLTQVFLNLIINHIEALPGGGTLRIAARHAGGQVELTFTDNGPGIPPDALVRIFEPFYTSKSDGTGLGLAVSHGIIQQHGGTITARNAPDGGAVFTIMLPVAPAGSA
jgi:PAS domain S-box-containing protein